jgi:hypothetical protein
MTEDADDSVALLLMRLANGEVELGEVAANFAARSWPAGSTTPTDYEQAAARELDDPDVPDPDSWETVETAFVGGQITQRQYAVLFRARQGMQDQPAEAD